MTGGLLALALLSMGEGPAPAAYLYSPRYVIDHDLVGPAYEYDPQPGDIMLSTDGSLFWIIMHNIALTSHPTHSGILFRRSDGCMAVLEGGPHDTLRCRALDALPHLHSYETEGRVWIRRRATPLTKEQSARLTEWAEAQDGKIFAIQRLAWQLSPLRPRGPLTRYFGKPAGPTRQTFYCSELVMESCVAAGLVDSETARPSATYPRDIFFDSSLNPYINGTLKMAPDWDPPARFVSNVREGDRVFLRGHHQHDWEIRGKTQAPKK